MGALAAQGRAYPVADGDVLVVAGRRVACLRADMVPASSFPAGGGRYADSIRLARDAAPQQPGAPPGPRPLPPLSRASGSPASLAPAAGRAGRAAAAMAPQSAVTSRQAPAS